jgi:NADPH:quinone reductase-like Zn-dependent oxidoreductase
VVTKPASIPFEEAAAVGAAASVALQGLRDAGQVGSGHQVLINGASGGVGTFAVQIAKAFGAQVTGVCSTRNLDLVRSIGADQVIDYTQEDFTRRAENCDVIFDVIGKSPYAGSMRLLRPNGRYVLANPRPSHLLRGLFGSKAEGKKIIATTAVRKNEDLLFLKELIEAEKLKTVIDCAYPLEQMVEAHKYVETGAKLGNLIVTV